MSKSSTQVWNMTKKMLSGELYDLTATSYLNVTGEQKIEHSLEHGISDTIQKYYDELAYVTNDIEDTKFVKRLERYAILGICKEIDEKFAPNSETITNPINKLFSFICNYINGGNGISQHDEQSLIIIVAGGNILTIFFNILKNILDMEPHNYGQFLIKLFPNIEENSKTELEKIIKGLSSVLSINIHLLKVLKHHFINITADFSDLDFIIVPNKSSILDSLFIEGVGGAPKRKSESSLPRPMSSRNKILAEKAAAAEAAAKVAAKVAAAKAEVAAKIAKETKEIKAKISAAKAEVAKEAKKAKETKAAKRKTLQHSKNYDESGVLLVRIKSANLYTDITDKTKFPADIKAFLVKLNNLYKENVDNCSDGDKQFLPPIYKLSQPQLFRDEFLRDPKISEKCHKFLEKLKAQKELIKHLTDLNIRKIVEHISVSIADDNIKLISFINFLHNTCKRQNNFIQTSLSTSKLIYTSKEDVKNNFYSLTTITDRNKPLASLCCELALDFLNNSEIKQIIIKINQHFVGCNTTSGTYLPVSVTNKMLYFKSRLAQSTTCFVDPADKIPNNSKITTNLIQPNPIPNDVDMTSEEQEQLFIELKEFLKEYMDMDEEMESITREVHEMNLGKGKNITRRRKIKKKTKKINEKLNEKLN